jgi:hypothetical protein
MYLKSGFIAISSEGKNIPEVKEGILYKYRFADKNIEKVCKIKGTEPIYVSTYNNHSYEKYKTTPRIGFATAENSYHAENDLDKDRYANHFDDEEYGTLPSAERLLIEKKMEELTNKIELLYTERETIKESDPEKYLYLTNRIWELELEEEQLIK